MRTTATLRTNDNARNLAELRSELAQLTAMVELHTECLETAAEAIKTLQDKILKASAQESSAKQKIAPKKPVKKAAAPKEQGRPWSKLNKDEKHKLNAYAYRHPEDFGGWDGWCEKRQTLMFR